MLPYIAYMDPMGIAWYSQVICRDDYILTIFVAP